MKSRKIYKRKNKVHKRRSKRVLTKRKKQKTKRRRLVKRKKRVSRKKKGGLLPDGKRCCKAEDVKFVKGHGSTIIKKERGGDGRVKSVIPDKINIPAETFVITLTKPGESSPFCQRVDEEIKRFYLSNNTLFENKDTSKKLSSEGLQFQSSLKSKGVHYEFKNHIPGMSMNNIALDFINNCNKKSCSIDCLKSSGEWYKEYCLPQHRDELIDSSEGIKVTLSDLLEDQGKGVYIIQVCRSISDHYESNPSIDQHIRKVVRQISSDGGISDEDYERQKSESERKVAGIKDDEEKMITETLSDVKQWKRDHPPGFIGPRTTSPLDRLTLPGNYEREGKLLYPESMKIPIERRKRAYQNLESNDFSHLSF